MGTRRWLEGPARRRMELHGWIVPCVAVVCIAGDAVLAVIKHVTWLSWPLVIAAVVAAACGYQLSRFRRTAIEQQRRDCTLDRYIGLSLTDQALRLADTRR